MFSSKFFEVLKKYHLLQDNERGNDMKKKKKKRNDRKWCGFNLLAGWTQGCTTCEDNFSVLQT